MSDAWSRSVRILVVSRPVAGRRLKTTLQSAGYEVHRTPSDDDLLGLVTRLHPHLVIVALDLPWGDAEAALQLLLDRAWSGALLCFGEARGDVVGTNIPSLPLDVEDAALLSIVRAILGDRGA